MLLKIKNANEIFEDVSVIKDAEGTMTFEDLTAEQTASLKDDGTCKVNKKCVCNKDGIVTKSTDNTGWRVLGRVNDNIVRV